MDLALERDLRAPAMSVFAKKLGVAKGGSHTSSVESAIATGLSRHIDFQPVSLQPFRCPEHREYAYKIAEPESVSK